MMVNESTRVYRLPSGECMGEDTLMARRRGWDEGMEAAGVEPFPANPYDLLPEDTVTTSKMSFAEIMHRNECARVWNQASTTVLDYALRRLAPALSDLNEAVAIYRAAGHLDEDKPE